MTDNNASGARRGSTVPGSRAGGTGAGGARSAPANGNTQRNRSGNIRSERNKIAGEYENAVREEQNARRRWQQEQERRRLQAEREAAEARKAAEMRQKQAERKERRASGMESILSHIRLFIVMFLIITATCVLGGYMYLNAAVIKNMLGGSSVVYVLGAEITREEARMADDYEYYKRRYFLLGSHMWSYDEDQVYINGDWYVNFTAIGEMYGFVVTGDAGEYSFITQVGSDNRASDYGDVVRFHVGTTIAEINGIEVRLPHPCVSRGGNIWVPYEFINYYVRDMTATYDSATSTMYITPLNGKPASSDNPPQFTLKYESYAPHIAESSLSEEILEQTDPVRIRAEREAKKRRAAEEAARAAEEEARAAAEEEARRAAEEEARKAWEEQFFDYVE